MSHGAMVWSVPVADGVQVLAQKVIDMCELASANGGEVVSVSHAGPVRFTETSEPMFTVLVIFTDA